MKYILLVVFCAFLTGCAFKSELTSVQNALEVERYNLSQSKSQLSEAEAKLSKMEYELLNEKNRFSTCEAKLSEEEQTIQNLQSQPKSVSYTNSQGVVTGTITEIHE